MPTQWHIARAVTWRRQVGIVGWTWGNGERESMNRGIFILLGQPPSQWVCSIMDKFIAPKMPPSTLRVG